MLLIQGLFKGLEIRAETIRPLTVIEGKIIRNHYDDQSTL